MSYLKTAEMKVQRSIIRELMLYEFWLRKNIVEATKIICRAKD